MAMAKVFLPELTSSEDHLTPFPRAPPPSPEMQPRSHGRVFEIPSSKFEGIGLDLRRSTFQFDEDEESPLSSLSHPTVAKGGGAGYGVGEQLGSSLFPRDSDEDEDDDENSFPGSPQKRVCCSPLTLPRDFMTTVFPSSTLNSLVSSGFGSFQTPSSFHGSILPGNGAGIGLRNHCSDGGDGGSHSHSDSPPYLGSAGHSNQTSPHSLILSGGGGGRGGSNRGSSSSQVTTHLTTPTLYPPVTLDTDQNTLSHSYDLHKMHPHLPQSFETTQLPEVRPHRSRTLDSASPSFHDDPPRSRSQTLDANYNNNEPNQRRRKISIKRKNPEDEGDADPSLQFSFEYSYSSTGSSGESEWLMVDCKVEPTRPMEKKACCAGDPSSVALSQGVAGANVSTLQVGGPSFAGFSSGGGGGGQEGGEGLFSSHHHHPLTLRGLGIGEISMFPGNGVSPRTHFTASTTTTVTTHGGMVPGVMGVVSEHTDVLTYQQAGPQSLESVTMMDLEGRLDSLDSMDCDQLPINAPISSNSVLMRGVAGGHVTMNNIPVSVTPSPSVDQPPLSVAMEHAPADGLVMRPHPHQGVGQVPRPTHSFPPGLRHSCVDGYLQPSLKLGDQEAVNLSKSL